MTSAVHFSNARQLLVEFQFIATPSLDFQVALSLGDTAPLRWISTVMYFYLHYGHESVWLYMRKIP